MRYYELSWGGEMSYVLATSADEARELVRGSVYPADAVVTDVRELPPSVAATTRAYSAADQCYRFLTDMARGLSTACVLGPATDW